MTHTPGPWTVDIDKNKGDWRYSVRDSNAVEVASVNPHMLDSRDANARLIAAAPAMLEALKAIAMITAKNNNRQSVNYIANQAIAQIEEGA